MTDPTGFDRTLSDWLDDMGAQDAPPRVKAAALAEARHTRRARALPDFITRIIPMTTSFPAASPRTAAHQMPLARLGLALALLALALLGAALFSIALSPAPPTAIRDGRIAFDGEGDIGIIDPAGGEPSTLISGPTEDSDPAWSPDGTRISFYRVDGGVSSIMVADADGSNARAVYTGGPGAFIHRWSPDGTRIVIAEELETGWTVSIVAADGSGVQRLDLGVAADYAAWHPSGRSLVFRGHTDAGVPGLYTVDLTSGIVAGPLVRFDPTTPLHQHWEWTQWFSNPLFSPDGSAVLYSEPIDLLTWQGREYQNRRARIVKADGSDDHLVEHASDSAYEGHIGWFPGSDRYALRVEAGGPGSGWPDVSQVSVAVGSADEPGAPLVTGAAPARDNLEISPSGATILAWGGPRAELIDVATGGVTELPTGFTGGADWQPLTR